LSAGPGRLLLAGVFDIELACRREQFVGAGFFIVVILMSGVPLKLIVGLGNPGAEYARTRHNAGFHLVDELARRHGGTFRSEPKHKGELAKVRVEGHELWLLKPMSFMNNSGGPTHSVAAFYKVPVESLLVAYDELDFSPGVVRLKQGGGAAGHNGMRDVIAQMGDQFWRLRIGIGHPGDRAAVLNFVLGRPTAEDSRLIDEAIGAAVDAVPALIAEGGQKAMHRLHTRNVLPGGAAPAP
jgi:peptidyl-tRNA hydrolase, PTH1 family